MMTWEVKPVWIQSNSRTQSVHGWLFVSHINIYMRLLSSIVKCTSVMWQSDSVWWRWFVYVLIVLLGVRFMWDSCCESVHSVKTTPGSGCILAHCMGLGKTFRYAPHDYSRCCCEVRKCGFHRKSNCVSLCFRSLCSFTQCCYVKSFHWKGLWWFVLSTQCWTGRASLTSGRGAWGPTYCGSVEFSHFLSQVTLVSVLI